MRSASRVSCVREGSAAGHWPRSWRTGRALRAGAHLMRWASVAEVRSAPSGCAASPGEARCRVASRRRGRGSRASSLRAGAADSTPSTSGSAAEVAEVRERRAPQARKRSAVGVAAVRYVQHRHCPGRVIDRVDDAILAATSAPAALEGWAQGCADPTRLFEQVPVDELQGGCGHDFWEVVVDGAGSAACNGEPMAAHGAGER